MKTALAAALGLLLCVNAAEARRARHISLAPVPVSGAMVDDRYPHLRLPEAYGSARAVRAVRPVHHRHKHRRQAIAQKRSLARGLVDEVRQALPAGRGL